MQMKPSITTVLVAGFGLLILVGMTLVLGISMWSARENTRTLIRDNARIGILSLARAIRGHLDPAEEAITYVAEMVGSGRLDTANDDRLGETLLATSAPAPQLFGLGFIRADGRFLRVRRGRGVLKDARASDFESISDLLAKAPQLPRRPFWGELAGLEEINATLIEAWMPIWKSDSFIGLLVSTVSASDLSRFIAGSAGAPLRRNRFVLYGRNHVLAHRNMADGAFRRSADVPLPRLGEVEDPVLQRIWSPEARELRIDDLGENVHGHAVDIGGEEHVYVYTFLRDYGTVPLIAGIYVGPADGLGAEFRRLTQAGIAGLAVISLSVAIAVLFGRRVSAPVRNLAAGSAAVAEFEFDRVQRLGPSRLRELDEAARAFNRMMAGLQWFETYVPRRLVRRLVERDAPVVSEEKLVTVIFTDIAGFSTLAERMPAADVARLLDEHFAILVDCIEAEDGTVDKYIGDSIMAFWEMEDTADRALRAVAAIRDGVRQENERRRAKGNATISLRIGVHTGSAIVGNVGAAGRINYTLIGDTVNVAARLEQLCKKIGGVEVAVLVSGDTARLASDRSGLSYRGRYPVRGRSGDVEVYGLEEQGGAAG